jgi:hypothetical protein
MADTDRGRCVMRALAPLVTTAVLLTTPTPTHAVELPGPLSTSADEVRHVIAISVDGLAVEAIEKLGPQGAPALHRMVAEGAGTLNARTAYEQTRTLPNHTGILTGRKVKGKRGHRVTFNNDPGGTVHRVAGRYVTSFFDVVHDHGRPTALLANKDKFAFFDRSWGPRSGAPDQVGRDDGRDKIDRFVYRERAAPLVRRILSRMERRAPWAATFLHLAGPDVVGHKRGFLSPAYYDAVRTSDRQVGRLLDAVAGDPGLASSTVVVLTADHGGNEKGHFDITDADHYTVPFLVWGAGVARGADLYALNPERTDPGAGRPAYRDAPPIRNTDAASLVTTLLGLPKVKGGQLRGTTPLEVSSSG